MPMFLRMNCFVWLFRDEVLSFYDTKRELLIAINIWKRYRWFIRRTKKWKHTWGLTGIKGARKVWDKYFGNLNETVKITSMKSRNRKPLYSMWKIDTLHLNQSELNLWRNHRGFRLKFSQRSKSAIGSRKSSKRGESKECLLMLLEAK